MDSSYSDFLRRESSSFDQPVDASATAGKVELPTIVCWRCGKDIPADLSNCTYCGAATTKPSPESSPQSWTSDRCAQSIVRLMIIFTVLLSTSIAAGVIQKFSGEQTSPNSWPSLITVLIFEAVDTMLIVIAYLVAAGSFQEQQYSFARRCMAWAFSMPFLAAMLCFNAAYHQLLISWLNLDVIRPDVIKDNSLLVWWAVAICVQPAVMEELFFRHLMFGSLRAVMGGHSVVWITAVMFAAAHVGVPLSLPVLFVLGVFLGYARLASGSLYLPIVLHFMHNACVMAIEGNPLIGF